MTEDYSIKETKPTIVSVKHNSYFCGMNPATYTFQLSNSHQQAV